MLNFFPIREGLRKLKDIYTTNQKFGDPQSALLTLKQNEEKLVVLNQQLVKYLDLFQEVELNGGISKTTATLSKQQKSLTLGRSSFEGNNNDKTMPRSSSQASVNSSNNNNSSIPGTPISHHNNSSVLTTTTPSATKQQPTTPNRNNTFNNDNESFDDDDDEDEDDYVNDNDFVDNGNQRPPPLNGNYDSMNHHHHPKIGKQFHNDSSSQYEPIDSPPLSSGIYRAEEEGVEEGHSNKDVIENEQIIGKALVIYEYKGTVQNAISIIENELLHVLEKDSGDGWTLVKRSNGEKGYVPTDYIRIEYF